MLPDLIPSEEVSRTRDAASAVLAELKRSCRDPDFELQLTAHMALFTLLDAFAEQQHGAQIAAGIGLARRACLRRR